jgi:AcrR family transcriptional regulator
LSTSAPYRHFENRDELLTAVAAQGYETLHQSLEQAAASTPTRLRGCCGWVVRTCASHTTIPICS